MKKGLRVSHWTIMCRPGSKELPNDAWKRSEFRLRVRGENVRDEKVALSPPRTQQPSEKVHCKPHNMKTEINACPFLCSAMCLLCRMREYIDVESFKKMCFSSLLLLVIEGSCDDNQICHELSHVSRKKNYKTTSESHGKTLENHRTASFGINDEDDDEEGRQLNKFPLISHVIWQPRTKRRRTGYLKGEKSEEMNERSAFSFLVFDSNLFFLLVLPPLVLQSCRALEELTSKAFHARLLTRWFRKNAKYFVHPRDILCKTDRSSEEGKTRNRLAKSTDLRIAQVEVLKNFKLWRFENFLFAFLRHPAWTFAQSPFAGKGPRTPAPTKFTFIGW